MSLFFSVLFLPRLPNCKTFALFQFVCASMKMKQNDPDLAPPDPGPILAGTGGRLKRERWPVKEMCADLCVSPEKPSELTRF
jgi:hypothetical protein